MTHPEKEPTVLRFLDECTHRDEDVITEGLELHQAYLSWSTSAKIRNPLGRDLFYRCMAFHYQKVLAKGTNRTAFAFCSLNARSTEGRDSRDSTRVNTNANLTLSETVPDQGQDTQRDSKGQFHWVYTQRVRAHTRAQAANGGTATADPAELRLPAWFEPTPFPYQLTGAIRAAEQNHTLIADEPGLGKTLQALAAAVLLSAQRILVIAAPVLLANWGREITRTHHLDHIPVAELLTITPATKKVTAATLPAAGYVVVSDAMLVSRRTLAPLLADWAPDLVIIDEAHRMKNPTAKRTRTTATITRAAQKTIALTGTPIISTPLDVLPVLDMLGHVAWFPGGTLRTFEARYTVPDRWGNARPFKKRLPELHALLEAFVWTRRTKVDVLTDLPAKLRTTHTIIPSHDEYVTAHADLDDAVDKYLAHNPQIDMEQLRAWASENRRYVSQLRRATGLAKIEPAVDWIRDHHDGAPERPLIVWGIHRDVLDGLTEQLAPHMRVATIHGGTGHAERDDIVQRFQAGEIDVLVAQIVAAGVGLTLTRSSDVLFVETDWTPAGVVQAEDRVHRIGQTAPVQITTLIAERTLDAKIHATLATSIQTLDHLTPGSDHAVTDASSAATVRDVLVGLVLDRHITRLTNGAAA